MRLSAAEVEQASFPLGRHLGRGALLLSGSGAVVHARGVSGNAALLREISGGRLNLVNIHPKPVDAQVTASR